MDGRGKSRGRRSLVKRHRGSRLSVPLPAARRQRVEPRLGHVVRVPDRCRSNRTGVTEVPAAGRPDRTTKEEITRRRWNGREEDGRWTERSRAAVGGRW